MVATIPIGWGWNYPLAWAETGGSIHAQPRRRMRCTTQPADLPISVAEAVLHLRLDPDAGQGPEAPLIEGLIAAATRAVEEYAGIAVMAQEWEMTLRRFPFYGQTLEIPLPPFDTLLSMTVGGDPVDIADYAVELDDRFPAKLFPGGVGFMWPLVFNPTKPDNIVIGWRCGRGNADAVPRTIKQAILMAVGTWYENRESLQQFTLTPMLEIGWQPLLGYYREPGFA
jgi:uncharacterized phiE125 gp8 family phage protein